MDCDNAIHRVYEYLDGCPPCARGFTFELELRQVIVSKCHEEVPAELRTRIHAAIIEYSTAPDPGPAT
jgi:hypothetical protein